MVSPSNDTQLLCMSDLVYEKQTKQQTAKIQRQGKLHGNVEPEYVCFLSKYCKKLKTISKLIFQVISDFGLKCLGVYLSTDKYRERTDRGKKDLLLLDKNSLYFSSWEPDSA